MIEVLIGNIFESDCSTIVNTVNCVGVMGKGIALEFKKRYPYMFDDYVYRCSLGEVHPGEPFFYQDLIGTSILNFPTKDHWRSPSKLSYILDGLDWFIEHYEEYSIESIAFPPLGCGNGGLNWHTVGPIMYQKLHRLPIKIKIYAPFGTPAKELSADFLSKTSDSNPLTGEYPIKINPKWYLLLYVVRELNSRTYSLKVGRTIFQKICYVLTRNGVNTGFRFSKGTYGPFSPDVRNSITALANANLILEEQLGKMISIRIPDSVIFPKIHFSNEEWLAAQKTIDLFSRIKSTKQAEMTTTVLYSYDQLMETSTTISDKDVYDFVLSWKPHWKSEKEFELCETIHNMAMLRLICITHSAELMDTFLV